jgi:hypothetical protein
VLRGKIQFITATTHSSTFVIAITFAMTHIYIIDDPDPVFNNDLIESVVPEGSLATRHFIRSRCISLVRDLRPPTEVRLLRHSTERTCPASCEVAKSQTLGFILLTSARTNQDALRVEVHGVIKAAH